MGNSDQIYYGYTADGGDEKTASEAITDKESSPNSSIRDSVVDWTPDEETRLVRKLDFIVMVLLGLGFFALQYDRGNIGNALTDFFFRDVGITQNQFNIGQQLLSAGIVLLEIPSNIVLYRVGPSIWISCQIVAFGLVATFQAFQKGLASYLATRLTLGLCESGFIPAGLFTITLWYRRKELAVRFACFFLANVIAQSSSGLVAYGILQMRGVSGLAGWQWMFIIEGLFTILVAGIFASLFPGTPANPVTLTGLRYFTEREVHIMRERIRLENPDGGARKSISMAQLKDTLTTWRIYPHLLLTICALAPAGVLWAYGPSLVVSYGYDRLKSNALVSVGGWLVIPVNVVVGLTADKLQKKSLIVIVGLFFWWGFCIGNLLIAATNNRNGKFAILTLSSAFATSWHPVNGSWLAANAKNPADRSIRMAMFIMSANASGIVGSQLFQAKDRPRYKTGWTVVVALISTAIVIAILNTISYWHANKKIERRRAAAGRGDGQEVVEGKAKYYI
ncbi:alternative sulfate transporter [Bisporella sp. PMI_857]|nr:alternative sulfate transporter [Bisporella sp. PMI_857]